MPSQRIVRSQVNELIQTILKSNVLPTMLTFSPAIPKTELQIKLPLRVTYEDPSFFFDISYDPHGSFGAFFFPDNRFEQTGAWHKTWSPVIRQFEIWLAVISHETSQPDPWGLLDQGSILKDSIPSTHGAEQMFTEQELVRLRKFLFEARNFLVTEANPTAQQLELVDGRLSYIEQSAKRQIKQDWAHTAVGVMFTISIGLVLAPDQANRLFQLTAHFLETIFIKLLT